MVATMEASVRMSRHLRVTAALFILAGVVGCSVAGLETVFRRRPHHRIEVVAIIPGRLSDGIASALDSPRFDVFGPRETDALLEELGVETWSAPPGPKASRILAASGIDVVVWAGSQYFSDWCEWHFSALAFSVHTSDQFITIEWCQRERSGRGAVITGTARPDSAELRLVGQELGAELDKQLRHLSDSVQSRGAPPN